jgi:hypothetical protein
MDKQTEQIANKFMNKLSTFLAIKEMQIKMTLRVHLTSVRMPIREEKEQKMLVRMQGRKNLHILFVGM